MKKVYWIYLFVISCALLTGCDTYPYKKDIQERYDAINPNGNKAICMMVSDVTLKGYPYTTHHMEGEDLPFPTRGPRIAYYNRLENENFHYFTGLGFFTEEYVGEEDNKPIYRYDITNLGRQYFERGIGGTNFCFGRIVVDSIDRTKDGISGVWGGLYVMYILPIMLKIFLIG